MVSGMRSVSTGLPAAAFTEPRSRNLFAHSHQRHPTVIVDGHGVAAHTAEPTSFRHRPPRIHHHSQLSATLRLVLVVVAATISGVMNSVAGGGTLLTFPA